MKLVQKRTEEKVTNPNTSDINIFAVIGIMLVSAAGIGYAMKKRFN